MKPIVAPLTNESHAYSQGYLHDGFIFTAGQVGICSDSGTLENGVFAQTVRALVNLSDVLVAGGSSLDAVLRTTCVLASMNDFDEFNRAYIEVFAGHKPARVTISATLGEGLLVEIDAIAAAN